MMKTPADDEKIPPEAIFGIILISIVGTVYLLTVLWLYWYKQNRDKITESISRNRSYSLANISPNYKNNAISSEYLLNQGKGSLIRQMVHNSFESNTGIQNTNEEVLKQDSLYEITIANPLHDDTILIDTPSTSARGRTSLRHNSSSKLSQISDDCGVSTENQLEISCQNDIYSPLQVEEKPGPFRDSNPIGSKHNNSTLDNIIRSSYDGYEGHEPFFTKHGNKLASKELTLYPFIIKKVVFNEAVSSLVRLFDGGNDVNIEGQHNWISFAKQDLMVRNHSHQIIDIIVSCSREKSSKIAVTSCQIDSHWGLCLSRCHLNSEESYSIVQAVILHPIPSLSLTQLDLSSNNLDDTFVMLLGEISDIDIGIISFSSSMSML